MMLRLCHWHETVFVSVGPPVGDGDSVWFGRVVAARAASRLAPARELTLTHGDAVHTPS